MEKVAHSPRPIRLPDRDGVEDGVTDVVSSCRAGMAAFAKSSFNAKLYSASRPTYPRQLYESIFRYHEHGGASSTKFLGQGPKQLWKRAVDLGCGTGTFNVKFHLLFPNHSLVGPGQATVNLIQFHQVYGVDPSKQMLSSARKYVDEELKRQGKAKLRNRFEFVQKSAEDLSFLSDGSTDLIVAGAEHCSSYS